MCLLFDLFFHKEHVNHVSIRETLQYESSYALCLMYSSMIGMCVLQFQKQNRMDLQVITLCLTISLVSFSPSAHGQFPFSGPYPQVVLPPYPGGRGLPYLPLPPPYIPSLPQLYPQYIRAGGVQAPRIFNSFFKSI